MKCRWLVSIQCTCHVYVHDRISHSYHLFCHLHSCFIKRNSKVIRFLTSSCNNLVRVSVHACCCCTDFCCFQAIESQLWRKLAVLDLQQQCSNLPPLTLYLTIGCQNQKRLSNGHNHQIHSQCLTCKPAAARASSKYFAVMYGESFRHRSGVTMKA